MTIFFLTNNLILQTDENKAQCYSTKGKLSIIIKSHFPSQNHIK